MGFRKQCECFVKEITDGGKLTEPDELNIVRKNVLRFINDAFNKNVGGEDAVLNYIAADSATVEVVDAQTGLCFRRELPLRYEETGNGISLIGEDIIGNSSQISFLSEAAYEIIRDLTGKGPDAPKCGGHGEHNA